MTLTDNISDITSEVKKQLVCGCNATSPQQVETQTTVIRFVVVHNILTCQDVVDLLYSFRFRFVVRQSVQQIHNKSNKWSLSISAWMGDHFRTSKPPRKLLQFSRLYQTATRQ